MHKLQGDRRKVIVSSFWYTYPLYWGGLGFPRPAWAVWFGPFWHKKRSHRCPLLVSRATMFERKQSSNKDNTWLWFDLMLKVCHQSAYNKKQLCFEHSTLFLFHSFSHFPLTSIFHELICFVAPQRPAQYWIHLVPIHPMHNLSITREHSELIIYWWNTAAMNF